MTGNRKKGRFTGIDMPERTTEVCFVCGREKIRRDRPGTDSDGLKEPVSLISKEDTARPGVCGFPDHITRFPVREAGAGCMR